MGFERLKLFDEAQRETPRLKVLLVLWAVAGLATGFFLAPRMRGWLEEYRSRTTGPAYGMANDAATAFAAQLATPEQMAALLGQSGEAFKKEKSCALTWTDREATYVYTKRASRARPETAHLTVTLGDRAVTGVFTADLWQGNCAVRAGDPRLPCTKVERARLVERRELPVARAAGDAPAPLLAGQCVWRQFDGNAGVVGRYKVALPAGREITVRGYVLPPSAFLSYRLSLGGREAPHVRHEKTVFQSIGEGEYEVEVTLLPGSAGAPPKPGEYTLQVHWGKGAGEPCPVPSLDERECYGVELPEPDPPKEPEP